MRKHCVRILMIAVLMGPLGLQAHAGTAQERDRAALALKAAIDKEVVDGDLKGAIEQYGKIAAEFAKVPEVAARALYQLGQCQEQLGPAEARKTYERIVRDYSGAQQYANAARARLAAIAGQDGAQGVSTLLLVKGGCGRVSWDGTLCPFIDMEGQVSLREFPGGATRRLTKPESKRGRANAQTLSRDGKQVAFVWLPDGGAAAMALEKELRVIQTDGTAERTIPLKINHGESFEPLDWFPDGKKILASAATPMPYWGLVAVDVATGEVRHLRNFATGVASFARAAVSPDGRWVIYDKWPSESDWNIYAMNVETGEESPVVTGPGLDSHPEWTSDGGKIVFRSDRNGSEAIWMINVANGKALGTPVVLRRAAGKVTPRGISRDGSLYYIQSNESTDVYAVTVNAQTLRAESAPARQIDTYVGHNSAPSWAPSGELFGYLSERDAKMRLVFHHRDGKEVMATEPVVLAWPFTPQWCGGRDRLAMFGMGTSYRQLNVYDARTGEVSQPAAEISGLRAAVQWGAAPDCKSVYVSHYSAQAKQRRIYRYDVATGKETDLVSDGGTWARIPVASPDSLWLAMVGSLEGGTEPGVLVVPTSGGALRMLAPGGEWGYSWTPDSKRLIFARKGELYWVPVEGGEPKPMGVRMPGVGFPTLNPDGRRLLFSASERSNEFWVVRNLPLN